MIIMFCTCTKLLQSWPMICDVYSIAVSLWFVSEKFVFSVVLLQSFWLCCFVAVFLVVLFCCRLSGCVVLLPSFWLCCFVAVFLVVLFCCSLSGCVVLLQSFWLCCFVAVLLVPWSAVCVPTHQFFGVLGSLLSDSCMSSLFHSLLLVSPHNSTVPISHLLTSRSLWS